VVVMDNLSPHKAPAVREWIEKAGAEVLYLPPYSVYIDIAGWVTVRANCKPYNPAGIVRGS
jgi:hypothetical protein